MMSGWMMAKIFAQLFAIIAAISAVLVLLAGCFGSQPETIPPDQRYGHRYPEEGPEGRMVVHLTPPEAGAEYFYYPAPVDTLHVRPAPFSYDAAGDPVTQIEVLIKGAFPNGCYELSDVEQEAAAQLITLTLTMRTRQDALCPNARRPYRFYYELDGRFSPGAYLIKLNETNFTFMLDAPPTPEVESR